MMQSNSARSMTGQSRHGDGRSRRSDWSCQTRPIYPVEWYISLHSSYKEDTPPEIFLNKFYELCDEYKGFCRLYTDGSLMENRVACVVVSRTSSESVRLYPTILASNCSFFVVYWPRKDDWLKRVYPHKWSSLGQGSSPVKSSTF